MFFSPAAHPYIALFELVRPFAMKISWWTDDISNGSGVMVLSVDRRSLKHPDRQTNKHTNRHYWKQYHPRSAGGKHAEQNEGAITSKLKHAIELLKTSPVRLAQLLQPSLAFCFSLQLMTAYRTVQTVRRH